MNRYIVDQGPQSLTLIQYTEFDFIMYKIHIHNAHTHKHGIMNMNSVLYEVKFCILDQSPQYDINCLNILQGSDSSRKREILAQLFKADSLRR